MTSQQKSIIFWIIFLVIVVAIFVWVIPKYGRLSKKFSIAQTRSLAATLTASSAANYTQRQHNPTTGVAITNCKDVLNIVGNNLPTGYEIVSQAISPDKVAICVLNGPGTSTVQFSVIGIS